MKEFAFGTEEQYNWLENLISDGQCHVFNNCVLPSSCTPDHARLGFDKLESVYAVYIDHGVTTTAEDPNFARFLQDGETKFMSMEDMSEFFHSLQPLFNTELLHLQYALKSRRRIRKQKLSIFSLCS